MQRLKLIIILMAILVISSGCSINPEVNPIDPEGSFWDRYFVYPLSEMLDWFANKMNGEYGLSILVVTVIIRFLILPLMIKQYKSSRAMQDLQPHIQEIRKKHKDNQQKIQEETMKLFQKHGVNPLAGCLPILIQMPILIALYGAIMRNPEISQHQFLWMDLGKPDPWILPILAAVTTYLQQKVMAVTMTPQMKTFMFILPILIFVMSKSFASALALYWVYSNIFTIVQSYFMYRKKDGVKQEGAVS